MRVISFVTQKGGAGKTTLAVNLAATAALRGQRTAILDLDPQGSAAGWFETRKRPVDSLCVIGESQFADATLERLRSEGYGLVLIDTPGANAAETRWATGRSDLCLVPIRPSVADVRVTMSTVRALTASGVPYFLVINQAPARLTTRSPCSPADGGPVLPIMACSRIDYQYAFALGLGVAEYAPGGKAAQEMKELWSIVDGRARSRAALETRLCA